MPARYRPRWENCNDIDDDCDGTVDGFATSCGVGECAAVGTCTAGIDSCVAGTPTAEVCDNLDNDCDGTVDGFATGCGVGVPQRTPATFRLRPTKPYPHITRPNTIAPTPT